MSNCHEDRCPLCGEPNACGLLAGQQQCWCQDVQIAPAVLEEIPEAQRNRQCLCRACATRKAACDSTDS